jgi:hypothetical protein
MLDDFVVEDSAVRVIDLFIDGLNRAGLGLQTEPNRKGLPAFHPNKCPDTIYVLKPGRDQYEVLDDSFYQQITSGQAGY